jgi:hypothetical protein
MTRDFQFRDENGNLRLDELLGEAHSRHYQRILEGASPEFAERQRRMQTIAPPMAWDAPPPAWRAEPAEDGLVRVKSYLPAVASSCKDLERLPSYCWDVCGYYRRLGVHWKATVRELKVAYNTLDPRQESEPLHYALMQLLNPQIRRVYDLMPLGGVFLLDRDVNEAIKQAAAREAARRMTESGGRDPRGARDDVMSDWGFDEVSPEEGRQRAVAASLASAPRTRSWGSSWGYYALVEPGTDWDDMPGPDEMEAWQKMVGDALAARGIKTRFAVGAHDSDSQIVLRDSNEACIFITGKGISPDKANHAIRMGISLGHIRIRREQEAHG